MICKSVYCDRKSVAKGLCKKHYSRFMKGKDFNKKLFTEMTLEERFHRKFKNSKNGCWVWTGHTRGRKGSKYGFLYFKGNKFAAHRISWSIYKNKLANNKYRDGLCVCHKCDNLLCVNPEHLYLGTHKQNMQDRSVKNRYFNRMKKLCKRGHKFNIKNTYTSKNGLRHCRECHRIHEKHRRARLRAGG